jgi:hypothetical protein
MKGTATRRGKWRGLKQRGGVPASHSDETPGNRGERQRSRAPRGSATQGNAPGPCLDATPITRLDKRSAWCRTGAPTGSTNDFRKLPIVRLYACVTSPLRVARRPEGSR